jgi:uncharacterized membrane protein
MAAGGILLSFVTGWIDDAVGADSGRWYYGGGPDGARTLLSALAGSMITVASLTFSLAIAALSLASQQYGPRLLRSFINDAGNQIVLGTFVGTFIYCLMVLRRVRGDEGIDPLVPQVSITVALVLAVAAIAVLIFFIDHVATSLRVSTIVTRVGDELDAVIEHLYPERIGRSEPSRPVHDVDEEALGAGAVVGAGRSGYVQAIDEEALLALAVERDAVVRIEHRPGGYVVRGGDILTMFPAEGLASDAEGRIHGAVVIGKYRTPEQDPGAPIEQLVQMALRALSPSLNDPATAIACIDQLCSSLAFAAGRVMPGRYRHDADGRLRVIADRNTYEGLVDASFNSIRQNARQSAAVTLRLLECIASIAAQTMLPEQRAALERQARMIERGAAAGLFEDADKYDVTARFALALRALTAAAEESLAPPTPAP